MRQPDGRRDSLRFSESFQSNSTPAFNHYFPYVENYNNSDSGKEDLVFKSPAKGTLLGEATLAQGIKVLATRPKDGVQSSDPTE